MIGRGYAWLGLPKFDSTPPAGTFVEGQQALMVKLLAGAGIAATAIILALSAVLIWGNWPAEHYRLILHILAGVIGVYGLTNIGVVFAFAIGGPVGSVSIDAGAGGLEFDMAARNQPAPGVKVETTVTTPEPSP